MPTYRDRTVRVALAVCSIALAVRTFAPGALTASALATVALPSATVLLMVVMEMLLATPPLSDEPKAVVAAASTSAAPAELASESAIRSVKVLFASQTGTAKSFAEQAARRFADGGIPATSMNLYEYDPLDLQFERGLVIFVLSTWTGGVPPAAARPFFEWIVDTTHDFRSPKSLLVGLQCAVFGLGNSLYADKGHHAKAGRDLEEMLKRLGAHAIVPVGVGDDMEDQDAQFQTWLDGPLQQLVKEPSAAASAAAKEAAGRKRNGRPKSSVSRFDGAKKKPLRQYRREKRAAREKAEAAARHAERQQKRAEASKAAGGGDAIPAAYAGLDADDDDDAEDRINALYLREEEESFKATEAKRVEAAAIAAVGAKVVRGAIGDVESDEEEVDAKTASKQAHNARGAAGGGGGDGIEDLEDLGFGLVVTSTASKTSQPAFKVEGEVVGMVTPKQDRALKKEGYHIIGTHSAVKLCRWTKNQLRGRGGCYKHTCYGITSYQCMEATPSLACANKCVFCWRHHKNPVGREWRWKTDEPDMIVNEAIAEHVRMMLTLRGMPGVQPARLLEAQTVRHCALSLVGEPIMYPHINRLCRLLHEKNISTFLVTNAQFPDAIANLTPVTQLYVSIDAATPKSLKAVDRPLFADYWERFINSLRMLREKKQRTTYRLTLVKSWNMEELADYAKLIKLGKPTLIEIKAVTFCGTSDASSLTMKNVPWHREVVDFARALCSHPILCGEYEYGIAAEHAHSCLILLAHHSCRVEGKWHTWIDYPKFHALERAYAESGGAPEHQFCAADYFAPTPEWALFGAAEQGFDPEETRFRRTRTGAVSERKYVASESGCG